MKAALVVCGSLETTSGGFLYDRELIHALRRAGDTVDVIEIPWEGYGRSLLRSGGAQARRQLHAWRGDLLLQDELAHPSLVRINGALRRAGRFPIVSIVHHLRVSEREGGSGRALARLAEGAYLRSVDAFVLNGEATRAQVQAMRGGRAPCIVAPPGGDRLGPGPAEEEVAARAFRGRELRVLFVGNLIPRKGLLTLLRALCSMGRDRWRLAVAGSADLDAAHAREIRRFIEHHALGPNVDLQGRVADSQLVELMRTHHVLAVPSSYEGFGIAYLEAMGFGLVPIGSSAGGAAQVIDHGRSGFLVAPGDSSGLAGILDGLERDRAALAALALSARQRHALFPGWGPRMDEVGAWLRSLASAAAA